MDVDRHALANMMSRVYYLGEICDIYIYIDIYFLNRLFLSVLLSRCRACK